MDKATYLKKLFSAYYKARSKDFPIIHDFVNREFAFLSWSHPAMQRHIGYPSQDFLLQHLISTAPRHSYQSATLYERPGADTMDTKGYLGCDFVVDIDADHIPTACRDEHNYSICKECKVVLNGPSPAKCPECGFTKFDKIIWICDECLNVAKKQVYHMIDNFLTTDFNIPLDAIDLLFSGHRGYHLHIRQDMFRKLDQDARREISDYVTGEGFSFSYWNFGKTQNTMHGFRIDQPGWPGKIARELYDILKSGEDIIREVFKETLTPAVLNQIVASRQYLLRVLEKKMNTWQVRGVSVTSWEKIFYALRDRVMADIDVVVTIDLHRLIRLPGGIHGKSGFKVMHVDFENLKDFDPLTHALSFPAHNQNLLKLKIVSQVCPKIRIADQEFGPFFQGEVISIPLNAGLFLLCKDVADLV